MAAGPADFAHLHEVWPKLWPLLEPAYKRSDEKSDILHGVISRDLQLWQVSDKNEPVAGIVSKLLRSEEGTSGELHCHLWLVGGSRMLEWAGDFLETIKPWARSEGCVALTGNGRRGWGRIVGRFGGYRTADRDGLPCWRLDL